MLSLAASASAATLYMHVLSGGQWQVFSLDQVDRLTFTGGNMNALSASGATVASFPQSSLTSMNIDEISSPSGVESVETQGAKLAIDGCLITYTGQQAAAVEIFDMEGRTIDTIEAVESGQSVDLSALASGVYLVKAGVSTVKVAVK